MNLTIRVDDITPGMDMEKFERFRALMDAHGVKPLLGVVPGSEDPGLEYGGALREEELKKREERFWQMLKALQQDGYAIAMHGVTHVYTTKCGGLFPLNKQSEFAGLKPETQSDMIAEGKRILLSHGIETDLFMAPSHTFDKNTIRALLDNGFTKMTDGFGTQPYRYLGMTFYPISFLRRKSVQRAACVRGTGTLTHSTTLVVHTNTMNDADFAAYEDIFKTCNLMPYTALFTQPVRELSGGMHALHYLMATAKRVANGPKGRVQ